MITTTGSISNPPVAALYAVLGLTMLYFHIGFLVGGVRSSSFLLYSKQLSRSGQPVRFWTTCIVILLFICLALVMLYIAKTQWTGFSDP